MGAGVEETVLVREEEEEEEGEEGVLHATPQPKSLAGRLLARDFSRLQKCQKEHV